jgi:hypothetical protein
MLRTFSLLTLLAGLMANMALAQRSAEFEGRYWKAGLAANARVDSSSIATSVDAKHDLGIGSTKYPEVVFNYASASGTRLGFSYTPVSGSGDQTVSRTVEFDGTTYTAGTRVISDFKIHHLRFGWAHLYKAGKKFSIGPTVQLHGFLPSGRLQAPALGVDRKASFPVGLPTVGLALEAKCQRVVTIYATVAGIKAGGYGYFLDGDGGIKVQPSKKVIYGSVGYRTFHLDGHYRSDGMRMRVLGPYVGIGAKF